MPQHVRGDNLGPVRQVHLRGTLTASSRQPRPDSRYCQASCVTTTTETGASHHPGPRPGRRDQHPARHRPGAAQPVDIAHRRHRRHDRHQGAAERETRRVVPAGAAARHRQHRPAPSGWARTVSFPGTPGTLSRSRSSSRPTLTLSPRPAPARPCSLPSAAPMPTARRSCSSSIILRTERGLRGQHCPGRHARHQPRRGADHRLRPVRRLRGMMQCRCGTPSCRATIGGQDWQRPDLQRKYGNYVSYLLHRLARQPDRPG
jgi:hypothetical protein